jgi:hypothetical protein
VIGTLRRECLDHQLVWNERHANRVLKEFIAHYHGRPHRGLRMQPPAGARWLAPHMPDRPPKILSRAVSGGLHHEYVFGGGGYG